MQNTDIADILQYYIFIDESYSYLHMKRHNMKQTSIPKQREKHNAEWGVS